ncbi:hypothetical protein GLOIN_2v1788404 [Rhizophagus irregularis DAOM 181602=DAOM 197198]|nr:hypothetical protein GLOIN_2v1788404 [Rhizophagus irregularis DAOM 181602=DAOM 197198]
MKDNDVETCLNYENSWENNDMVAYNIKNFLEILPSMDILNKRSPEIYKSGRCVRCGHAIETWTHMDESSYN